MTHLPSSVDFIVTLFVHWAASSESANCTMDIGCIMASASTTILSFATRLRTMELEFAARLITLPSPRTCNVAWTLRAILLAPVSGVLAPNPDWMQRQSRRTAQGIWDFCDIS